MADQLLARYPENHPRLSADVRRRIAAAGLVFVSVASAWEAATKVALGKLKLPQSFEAGVIASRFDKLPITFRHAEVVATLPHHHSDPFDRMLVAQALSERLALVTYDRRLPPYAVDQIWI